MFLLISGAVEVARRLLLLLVPSTTEAVMDITQAGEAMEAVVIEEAMAAGTMGMEGDMDKIAVDMEAVVIKETGARLRETQI